uniref:Uncharacterized protein n=1 Tax=Salmo trutta TaxID=8032 RepID=A0A674A4I0_SALTR
MYIYMTLCLFDRHTHWLLSWALPWCHGGCCSHHVAGTNLRYVLRCAVLYCPGNNERKLRKLASLSGLDCDVLDCEDGVALSKKVLQDKHRESERRESVTVSELRENLEEREMRVIKLMSNGHNSYVCLCVCVSLTEPIYLVTFVENAVSFLKFKEVCCLAPTVGLHNDGVVFESDDFCASIGSGGKSTQLSYLGKIKDTLIENDSSKSESHPVKSYLTKQVIHPKQVQAVQEEFSPSQERQIKQGKIFFFMIDMPSVKQAQSIVMLAAAVTGK